jgi:hypothetical protein
MRTHKQLDLKGYSLSAKVCVVLFFSLLFLQEVAYAGFGITPPYVRNDRLTQGSEFTQEILLVRGDPVEDLKAEITLLVPGIEDWITIDKGTEFLLPTGEKQVAMKVTVRVPDDAPYERYQGSIRVRTMSPDPASGVSIALGAQIDVDIRVVDEIRDFEVKRVKLSEAEEPKSFAWLEFPGKMSFTIGIQNTGNAPTAPARVQFDIYDKRGNVVLESTENTNDIEEVLPFETRDVVAYLPTRLPPGAYFVRYSIYQFDDEVKRTGELTLSVLPSGTLVGYEGYGIEGLSYRDKLTLIVPPGLLMVLILAYLGITIIRRNRKHRRRTRRPRVHHREEEVSEYSPERPQRTLPPEPRTVRRPMPQQGGVVDLSGRRRVR